jgi:hypothetical protein
VIGAFDYGMQNNILKPLNVMTGKYIYIYTFKKKKGTQPDKRVVELIPNKNSEVEAEVKFEALLAVIRRKQTITLDWQIQRARKW